ncbi:hypothetical protein L3Y34_016835 [Caenorhabditis briggsae]|uniref:PDZ domain-containing protein n=1 Tax=Caenorhabditis briggsae TaxID=6238 RepID=A0AAE9DHI4_CAEBR|nr:hypothetical protein L3Y34_016835 [Caenorhabditis briggsae]
MSGIENNKENKKQQKALKKSKKGSIRKSVSGTKQAKNSAKCKHKKRASQDKDVNLQTLEQRSEIFTSDVSEGGDDKEENTASIKKNYSVLNTVSNKAFTQLSAAPTPPLTHFLPVVIQVSAGTFERFFQYVTVNRNLVITKVDRSLIHHFMPGDQITIVDGTAHWTIESLTSYMKGSWIRGKPAVAITVIRVWNINCITKAQYDLISMLIEDRVHYFRVKLYSHTPNSGMVLCSEKKRILVKSLRAKTPASTGFIVGDQILGVNNEMYDVKKEKMGAIKKKIREAVQTSFEKDGCVEVIACRLIGARSSPVPSLDAELAEKFAGYAIGVEKGIHVEKKRDENTNLPFEADALEIALRELTTWRYYEGRNGFETPICDKGPSLLSDKGTYPATPGGQNDQTATSSPGTSTPSSSNTQVSVMAPIPIVRTTSNTVMAEKLAVEKPTNKGDKPPSTPIAQTPRKRSVFRKEIENPQTQVTFKDAPEINKITSDVPEENEVKKCDARSGMIAYFKNIMK